MCASYQISITADHDRNDPEFDVGEKFHKKQFEVCEKRLLKFKTKTRPLVFGTL
jgi:hypothetical protein